MTCSDLSVLRGARGGIKCEGWNCGEFWADLGKKDRVLDVTE